MEATNSMGTRTQIAAGRKKRLRRSGPTTSTTKIVIAVPVTVLGGST
jgi:hypothetical protein